MLWKWEWKGVAARAALGRLSSPSDAVPLFGVGIGIRASSQRARCFTGDACGLLEGGGGVGASFPSTSQNSQTTSLKLRHLTIAA